MRGRRNRTSSKLPAGDFKKEKVSKKLSAGQYSLGHNSKDEFDRVHYMNTFQLLINEQLLIILVTVLH